MISLCSNTIRPVRVRTSWAESAAVRLVRADCDDLPVEQVVEATADLAEPDGSPLVLGSALESLSDDPERLGRALRGCCGRPEACALVLELVELADRPGSRLQASLAALATTLATWPDADRIECLDELCAAQTESGVRQRLCATPP